MAGESACPTLVARWREQIWPPPGTDTLVGSHLEQRYGGRVMAVAALDAAVFSVDWADGRRWIARLFRPARPVSDAACDAEILRWLEAEGFPAERCAHPEAVSAVNGRGLLVTDRVEGANGRSSRSARLFRTLGELLGRLQTMQPEGVMGRPAGSWHHLSFEGGGRRDDIAVLDRLLVEARDSASARDKEQYEILRERLGKLDDFGDLPQAPIHPDFSTPNVIISPEARPVIVDWTGAGRGPRILALGTLLSCAGGDMKLVDAIIGGYCRHIRLEREEALRLAGAVRGFGLIVDCWSAVFRPKSLARIIQGRPAKYYVAKMIAGRALEQLRARVSTNH